MGHEDWIRGVHITADGESNEGNKMLTLRS